MKQKIPGTLEELRELIEQKRALLEASQNVLDSFGYAWLMTDDLGDKEFIALQELQKVVSKTKQ